MAAEDQPLQSSLPGEPNDNTPFGFFAYPSYPPMLPPTIRAAIEAINATNTAVIAGWEDISINGRYIIGEIKKTIDGCDFFCADVTGINPNVMFEIGYAIARNKRVWLVRDGSLRDVKKDFDQLKLLTTVGYTSYTNSAHIITAFFRDEPYKDLTNTIYENSISSILGPQPEIPTLLYLKSLHDTEASVHVTRSIEDAKIPTIVNDPTDSNLQPLTWFAQKLWDCVGCITHFVSADREGFKRHNARYALISGLAVGLNLDLLMLTEQSELLSPVDYRELMQVYATPTEAATITSSWLVPRTVTSSVEKVETDSYHSSLKLATQLKDFHIQLGDWTAENEKDSLMRYFVETTVSLDILNGTQNVFVGRKGTGKSANLIYAERKIGEDNRNLICLIKPLGYEIEGLVRLFSRYKAHDTKGYVIESLWKYMLYTELASAAQRQINNTALWELSDPDVAAFIEFMEKEGTNFGGDFTIRLERIVNSLELITEGDSEEAFRKGISEALHAGALSKLRIALSKMLARKRQVLLLVDNLDKPWTKTADLGQLAEFISGLLVAASRLGDQLNKGERNRPSVKINSAIFLRSDIFDQVLDVTTEPDKLSYTRIKWDDPEMLIRVIEERYISSHGPDSNPAVMWRKYFCPEVKGVPTRAYLTSRILQRPRDIVYLVKAAVANAVNRKRDRVEEKDILDGEKEYSQYALDSILVENVSTVPQLEQLLFEFVGSKTVVDLPIIHANMVRAGIAIERSDEIVNHLVRLSFFGLEIDEDRFAFAEESRELRKNHVLSNRFYETHELPRRYEINKPFRAYLEVMEQEAE